MKPEQLYRHLIELAEKLNITVSEQNLRNTPGIKVKSGYCIVKGNQMFIMDKHRNIRDKTAILAAFLSKSALEDIYVVPAVRDVLSKYTNEKTDDTDDDDIEA